MKEGGFRVEPLTPERWHDFETVLGKGGISGCWCMYWLCRTNKEWAAAARGGGHANKAAFRRVVKRGPPPGLLAYDGDEPVAWCRLTPREQLLALDRSRNYKTGLPVAGVWSLSCFVVRRAHRGRGLTEVLTRAAARFARRAGARTLEVYPTDTEQRKADASVYMGVASTFTRLGFSEAQRRSAHKPMMRLRLR